MTLKNPKILGKMLKISPALNAWSAKTLIFPRAL